MTTKHSPKVFVWDLVLVIVWGLGFLTGAYHLIKYLSEYLVVDEKHLKFKTGVLSNSEVEVPFNKINSISIKQTLFGKLLGYGDIIVNTGNDVSGIVFKSVDDPQSLKKEIQAKIA